MCVTKFSTRVLVALPVYDEEDNLKVLIPQILDLGGYLKILMIDDCSSDKSLEVAKDFQKEYPERVFIISQIKRLGRGNALKVGYKFALENNFKYLIEMDADLSHRPKDIAVLLREASDVDMVIGSRLIRKGSMQARSFLRKLITYLSNIYLRSILGIRGIKDLTSGFRCTNLDFLHGRNPSFLKTDGPGLLQEIIFKNKDKIRVKEIPIIFQNRFQGKSKFGLTTAFRSLYIPLYWRIEDWLSSLS